MEAKTVADGFRALMGTLPIDTVEHVNRGYGHSNWKISRGSERFLLRIAVRHPTSADIMNEVEATRLARSAGVPAPEVVAVCTDMHRFGAGFLVQRWVEGESAADWVATQAPHAQAALGESIGELLARLHSVSGTAFGERLHAAPYRSWVDACTERLRKVRARHAANPQILGADAERVSERCLRLAEYLAPSVRPALTHRDLYLPNVLIHAGSVVAILDYEHACYYDPLWDFVKLHWWLFRRYPALELAVLRGYRAVAGWPANGDERVFLCQGIELLDAIHFFTERIPVPELAYGARQLLEKWLRARNGAWNLEG